VGRKGREGEDDEEEVEEGRDRREAISLRRERGRNILASERRKI